MIAYAKKLALGAALFGMIASTALPACAAALPKTVSASSNSSGFNLPSISWPWDESVKVEKVEPGAYEAVMTVGQTQQLAPSVLPEDASNKTVSYQSSDESIAAVSNKGVVQALAAGKVRIAAMAGDAAAYYDITVQTDSSTWVKEMDITLSASRIAVGDTASVSVQVLPTDATNFDQFSLTSSNTAVATVNSFGKITGVAPGTATITAACGDVSAKADITVVNTGAAGTISLSTNYVVLKPGGTVTIKATVTPSSAPQNVTFKTNDSSVAAVSTSGVVTATGTGATSIIVSNGMASALVTVIVNRTATAPDSGSSGDNSGDTPSAELDPVVSAIQNASGTEVVMNQSEVPVVTSAMLEALRTANKSLVLNAADYTMRIDGAALTNTNNELETSLSFSEADNGLEFTLNSANALPGEVVIELNSDAASYRSLYLYNELSGKWQYLNSYASGKMTADSAGRYLLTNETLNVIQVNWYFLGGAGVILVAIVVAYIAFKKRYWFW